MAEDFKCMVCGGHIVAHRGEGFVFVLRIDKSKSGPRRFWLHRLCAARLALALIGFEKAEIALKE